jgi:hypothetical protein
VDFEDEFVQLFKEVAQTFELRPTAVATLVENDGD